MNNDKSILLIILQFLLISGLLIMDMNNQPMGIFGWVLFAALFVITIILLIIRLDTRAKQKFMISDLKRAVNGNLNTRLLTNDNSLFAEVIFSINQLIEQLDNLQARAVKNEAARKRLLSSISHDIRTPLTSIIGYIDALKDDVAVSEDETQEYLEIISRKANGLKHLIDEIFHMAKLDADEISLEAEFLDFAEIARESVIDFLPELKKYDIELKVSIPEKKCKVCADRLSLLRITCNIIKNALQYGKEGKVLGIELTETPCEYNLHIWDQGPGISKEDLPYIFERMYRADKSRNPLNRGSGLGLAIAKALAEKNGGTIWVESIPGEKTVMGFSLPKANHQDHFKK